MLERWIFNDEENAHFLRLFTEMFIVFLVVSFLNYFIKGNFLFLVALSSISVAYPVTKYIRREDHNELFDHSMSDVLQRFDRQMLVFWVIFIAATIAFIITFGLLTDTTFHANIVESVSGRMVNPDLSFSDIFFNNLYVGFITFLVALVSTSGIIFIIVWNASMLTYVLAQSGTRISSLTMMFSYLGHALLEIGGFVMLGMAASLLSYRIERFKRFDRHANKVLFINFSLLVIIGIVLIFLGALVETL
ncbi:MAG: stage II sporulation protein M [Candidatus Woesearchaeota archaeon]